MGALDVDAQPGTAGLRGDFKSRSIVVSSQFRRTAATAGPWPRLRTSGRRRAEQLLVDAGTLVTPVVATTTGRIGATD